MTASRPEWPAFMSPSTAARFADVSRRTIFRWIEDGLPCARVNKVVRIRMEALEAWLAGQSPEEEISPAARAAAAELLGRIGKGLAGAGKAGR
ncbi:MAG: helix-turn-helix domain-containing protein [Candidatus Tectomicrobia bacterium]|uniref:Helix-turn-helix domain-containing protein n=1 Tax=Tectimicrobiota bacterium TaxID=2528274 RepID=A0A932MNH1_UNCTE|nr:helix-turn-helix domain-containing protein [Candidatus Tectomicrobia bacterium]